MSSVLKNALTNAGLTQAEFATIARISRVMVNRYINRGSAPMGNNKARVNRAIELVLKLRESGKLPLPEQDKERRARNVEKIRAHLDAAK